MQAPDTAEQAVLASVLMDPGCIADVADHLHPNDFAVLDHQHIYAAMLACHSRGQRADLVTVADELTTSQHSRLANDIYLIVSGNATVAPVHVEDYAKSVIRQSRRRSVVNHATDLIQRLHADPDADPVEMAHQVMSDISRISDSDAGPRLYAEVMESFQERLTLQVAGAWEERVLQTRLHDLDRQLGGGFRPGELIILGGRPGSGKTALLLQVAHNVARNNDPVLVFSGEMSMTSLVERGFSEMTGIPMHDLRRKTIPQPMFERLMSVSERMANMPVAIDDTSGLTTAQMMVRAQRFQRKHGLGLIVFDYLELAGDQNKQGDTARLGMISRQLKHIARSLDVPFLALSQLSRNVENRTPPIPRMSDLRQSGSIEADADIVLLLYRHDYYVGQGQVDFDGAKEGIADIYVGKQRNGADGMVSVHFDSASMRFLNIDHIHEQRGIA